MENNSMTFKTFKNDKERKAFLSDYRNKENGWYLWTFENALERRWWRLELTEGISFIVEEDNLFLHFRNDMTNGHHSSGTSPISGSRNMHVVMKSRTLATTAPASRRRWNT